MGEKSAALPTRIELPESSVIVRIRSLDSSSQKPEPKVGAKMATYRVVLRIDVDEDDILKNRGEQTLAELKENEKDYLRAHVEQEIGWLEQSFSRVETQSVTRLNEPRRTSKRITPTSRKSKS